MEIIQIDCGGTIFKTHKHILMKCGYFKNMFDNCNDTNNIFIDCDPVGFKHILEHLRFFTYKIPKQYKYLCDFFLINGENEIYQKKSKNEIEFENIYNNLELGKQDGFFAKCLNIYVNKLNKIIPHLYDHEYVKETSYGVNLSHWTKRVELYSLEQRTKIKNDHELATKLLNNITNMKTLNDCLDNKLLWIFVFENKQELSLGNIIENQIINKELMRLKYLFTIN